MPYRTLRIVLLVSVALNLFLAGFVTARWWTPLWHHPRRGMDVSIEWITGALEGKDAEIMRGAFNASEPQLASLVRELQQARHAMRAKLEAEPFDTAGFAAALANVRAKRQAVEKAIQDVIIQSAGELSPEGRKRLFMGRRR